MLKLSKLSFCWSFQRKSYVEDCEVKLFKGLKTTNSAKTVTEISTSSVSVPSSASFTFLLPRFRIQMKQNTQQREKRNHLSCKRQTLEWSKKVFHKQSLKNPQEKFQRKCNCATTLPVLLAGTADKTYTLWFLRNELQLGKHVGWSGSKITCLVKECAMRFTVQKCTTTSRQQFSFLEGEFMITVGKCQSGKHNPFLLALFHMHEKSAL